MAARSTGSGTISFGLVSIPFKVYTATSAQSVSFNQLHKKCGSRLKQQLLCPVDNEVVQRADIVKGYEYQKDRYVQFSEDELKKLEAERTDRIDIVEFVPADTVDFVYIERTQYLGPDKGGDRAYRLLGESMKRMNRIAVGRYGTRGKESLVLIRPYLDGLILHQVYYADEVRSFDDVERPGELEFKPIEAELADKLIEQLSVERFNPEQYHDTYRERVMSAVEQKAAGEDVTVAPEAPQAQIIDLFEALKRSLKADDEPKSDAGDKPEVKKVAPKRETKKKEATG